MKKIHWGRDSLCINDTETIGNVGEKSTLIPHLTSCIRSAQMEDRPKYERSHLKIIKI